MRPKRWLGRRPATARQWAAGAERRCRGGPNESRRQRITVEHSLIPSFVGEKCSQENEKSATRNPVARSETGHSAADRPQRASGPRGRNAGLAFGCVRLRSGFVRVHRIPTVGCMNTVVFEGVRWSVTSLARVLRCVPPVCAMNFASLAGLMLTRRTTGTSSLGRR
jgi:hypothetical protein